MTNILNELRNRQTSRASSEGQQYAAIIGEIASGKDSPKQIEKLDALVTSLGYAPEDVEAHIEAIKQFNDLSSLAGQYEQRQAVATAARIAFNENSALYAAGRKKLDDHRDALDSAVNKAASAVHESQGAEQEQQRIKNLAPHLFAPYLPAKDEPQTVDAIDEPTKLIEFNDEVTFLRQ